MFFCPDIIMKRSVMSMACKCRGSTTNCSKVILETEVHNLHNCKAGGGFFNYAHIFNAIYPANLGFRNG